MLQITTTAARHLFEEEVADIVESQGLGGLVAFGGKKSTQAKLKGVGVRIESMGVRECSRIYTTPQTSLTFLSK